MVTVVGVIHIPVDGVMAQGRLKRDMMKDAPPVVVLVEDTKSLALIAMVKKSLHVRVVMERGVRNVRSVVARGR